MKRHDDDNEDKEPDTRPRLHQVTSHTTCLHTRITYDSNTTSLINRPRRLHLAWWRCPSHWFICCRAIPSLLGVSHTARWLCACLYNLDLSSCEELDNARFVSSLVRLRTLDLSYCRRLSNVSPLSFLTSLTNLKLSWTKSDVTPLSSLTSLTSLDLRESRQLSDVSPLSSLTSLTSLNLRFKQVSGVSALTSLPQLTILR